jgi:hypothetical protein
MTTVTPSLVHEPSRYDALQAERPSAMCNISPILAVGLIRVDTTFSLQWTLFNTLWGLRPRIEWQEGQL